MGQEFSKFIGKKIKLVFRDAENVSIRQGILKEVSEDFVFVETKYGTEAIPTNNVIRMELGGADA